MTDIFLVASSQDGILFVKSLQGKIIEIDKLLFIRRFIHDDDLASQLHWYRGHAIK